MTASQTPEIDHRILKLMVGLIGLFLAVVTSGLSGDTILSISHSHCYGGWARDFFVGALFAIAAFMAAYNGQSRQEMVVSKVTAVAAIAVAWFPTKCPTQDEIIPGAHVAASILMFLMLVLFCRIFYKRARSTGLANARRRARLYAVCGFVILASMGLIVVDHLLDYPIKSVFPRLEFYCEMAALIAFGVAWLAASHIFPFITAPEERWLGR